MQKRFVYTSALAVLSAGLVPSVSAAPKLGHSLSARLTEPTGGFSYVPPAGWHIRTFPGLKYKISYAMPVGGFAPNINVVDETAAVPMAQYVQLSLTQMKRVYTSFHVASQSPFVTASGLHGVRLVSTGTMTGRNVRQIFYLFPASGARKLVVTASWLASDGDKYTAATDGALKTFALK